MVTPVFPIPVDVGSATVAGPKQGQWTAAHWEVLPDDGNRYEIIDGVLYMSTAPSAFHQYIIWQLVILLGAPAQQQGIAQGFFAPIGVFMPGCDPVQPDFVVVRKTRQNIIRDRRIFGVPDLIIEVLSPGSREYDEGVKLTAYATAGVPEYAVIDPAARRLRYHRLEHPGQFALPQSFNAADSLTFACLPGISLLVGSLFEGAPDTTV